MLVIVVLLLLFVTGCSGADLLNAMVPREGYSVLRDQSYGDGPRRRADVYRPDGMREGMPTVIFFYGGRWQSGSKDDFRFVGQAFAAAGYITVIPDYRLYPEVRYPEFLEDAAAAVAWVHRRQGGKSPVYLVGHSAGAYIVAMLTLDGRHLARAGAPVCDSVAASVGLAGPYNFLPLEAQDLKTIFGPEDTRPRTQPINYVDGTAPPMLLISGSDDETVVPANSKSLAARIRAEGGVVQERYYDDVGHVRLVASLSEPLRGASPAFADTLQFLKAHRQNGMGCR